LQDFVSLGEYPTSKSLQMYGFRLLLYAKDDNGKSAVLRHPTQVNSMKSLEYCKDYKTINQVGNPNPIGITRA
jgi:hypothetical protein